MDVGGSGVEGGRGRAARGGHEARRGAGGGVRTWVAAARGRRRRVARGGGRGRERRERAGALTSGLAPEGGAQL
jgi:hypothetical protein